MQENFNPYINTFVIKEKTEILVETSSKWTGKYTRDDGTDGRNNNYLTTRSLNRAPGMCYQMYNIIDVRLHRPLARVSKTILRHNSEYRRYFYFFF